MDRREQQQYAVEKRTERPHSRQVVAGLLRARIPDGGPRRGYAIDRFRLVEGRLATGNRLVATDVG